MFKYDRSLEKFEEALKILICRLPIRERLIRACELSLGLSPDLLPEDAQADFIELQKKMNESGNPQTTISQLSDIDADNVAEKIFDIYQKVDHAYQGELRS